MQKSATLVCSQKGTNKKMRNTIIEHKKSRNEYCGFFIKN